MSVLPSSSESVTRAMRGQPKRLPQTRNGEKCGEKSFYMYDFQKTLHTKLRQMLSSHPAVSLLDPAFVLLCAHLPAHYFSVYWVLGSLRKPSLAATSQNSIQKQIRSGKSSDLILCLY